MGTCVGVRSHPVVALDPYTMQFRGNRGSIPRGIMIPFAIVGSSFFCERTPLVGRRAGAGSRRKRKSRTRTRSADASAGGRKRNYGRRYRDSPAEGNAEDDSRAKSRGRFDDTSYSTYFMVHKSSFHILHRKELPVVPDFTIIHVQITRIIHSTPARGRK